MRRFRWLILCLAACVLAALGIAWALRGPSRAGMVRLPGGAFVMGCVDADTECLDWEKPAHRVVLSPFWMDIHPVTVAEYAECVREGSCGKPEPALLGGPVAASVRNWRKISRRNHPVTEINWQDAATYCRWKNKRLPTEAEYEYALRGGRTGDIYPWGAAEIPPAGAGNYADESYKKRFPSGNPEEVFEGYDDRFAATSPVCEFAPNRFGLCDISGNVEEWCADWYGDNYYAESPDRNPRGPSAGERRIQRGASWTDSRRSARLSSRGVGAPPKLGSVSVGFRCVRDRAK